MVYEFLIEIFVGHVATASDLLHISAMSNAKKAETEYQPTATNHLQTFGTAWKALGCDKTWKMDIPAMNEITVCSNYYGFYFIMH